MDGMERVLTVMNYGESEKGELLINRITIAPHLVHFVVASEETHSMIDGRELRKVNVVMSEGGNLELYISVLDLTAIERAIGTYILP